MSVKIYQPTKNPMQSGKSRRKWRLEYVGDNTKSLEGVMGWTSSSDMEATELELLFDTKEEAIRFANQKHLRYEIISPNKSTRKLQSYSENFQ
jgi:hypothetical protein